MLHSGGKKKNQLLKLQSSQFTKEFRQILSEDTSKFNRLTKSKKVKVTDIKTGLVLEYSSWREASSKFKKSSAREILLKNI